MITRPATFRLRFRFLKIWRQKTPPRTYATLTGEHSPQTWPHQSQFGNIHDDQVARLAARPLHPLALADLIRYYLTLLTQRLTAIDFSTAMVVLRSPPRLSSPPPTSPSLCCPSDSPTAFKLSGTFPSSWSQTHTSLRFTVTTFTPSPPCSRTRNAVYPTSKMRSNSPRSWLT